VARKLTSNRNPPAHDWFVKNGKWKPAVQAYLSCVSFMDAQLGRVLNALEKSTYAKNTIVVMFSDHGFHLGEKQRWAKQSLWETSTHVPMIISLPGGLRGRRCSRPVELIQVFPTLVELCGIRKRKGLEGVSIKPLLDDPEAEWTRPALTTFKQNNHAVRSERWRYIRYSDGSEELYDHSKDPNEWHNLAGKEEHRKVMDEHARWIPEVNVANAAQGAGAVRKKRKERDSGALRAFLFLRRGLLLVFVEEVEDVRHLFKGDPDVSAFWVFDVLVLDAGFLHLLDPVPGFGGRDEPVFGSLDANNRDMPDLFETR
ncbi:MAG: sulfatase-like hydrolase/transferase, partial [Planctomycetota bacterium]|nr:sulfatase-like hydrolase/transferase [Planctomycetota bacterium]